jgi:hypothetical protein
MCAAWDVISDTAWGCGYAKSKVTGIDGGLSDRRPIWFAVGGAVLGAALGILVSVTTDVPLAPEAGLVLGALVGWFWAARLRR